jgi:hypothetical protein
MYEMEGPRWHCRIMTADCSAATLGDAYRKVRRPARSTGFPAPLRLGVAPEMASAFRDACISTA